MLDFCLFAHAGCVKNPEILPFPFGIDRNGVTGDASLGAGQQTVLAKDFVDQGRFSGIRAANHGNLQRFIAGDFKGDALFVHIIRDINIRDRLIRLPGKFSVDRAQNMIEFVHAFAMFSRQAQWFTKTKVEGVIKPLIRSFALGFVDPQNHPTRTFAQNSGQHLIGRGHPDTPVDQEQADIGHVDRTFRQRPHAALQAVVSGFFQTGGVNHCETQIAKARGPLAQITGHARSIINQRQFLFNHTVEQRRFPDIRAANNGKCKRHIFPWQKSKQRGRAPLQVS